MLYLTVVIYYYTQLQKINQELAARIRDTVEAAAKSAEKLVAGFISLQKRDDTFLFAFEHNEQLDRGAGRRSACRPEQVIELVFQLCKEFDLLEDELYGYNLFLSFSEYPAVGASTADLPTAGTPAPGSPGNIVQEMRLATQEENRIWLDAAARVFFSKFVQVEQAGAFWRLLRRVEPERGIPAVKNRIWNHEPLVKLIVKAVNEQYLGLERGNAGGAGLRADPALSVVLLPAIIAILLWLTTDRKLLGRHVNRWWTNAVMVFVIVITTYLVYENLTQLLAS